VQRKKQLKKTQEALLGLRIAVKADMEHVSCPNYAKATK
jgi:hypothetical protein